jgi:hypothetical protein
MVVIPDRTELESGSAVFASLTSKARRLLKGRVLVVTIVLVVAIVVVVVLVASGGSDSPAVAPGVTTTQASASTSAGAVVTVVGTVNKLIPNGDFVVNDTHSDYTIVMSSNPKVVDLTGVTATAAAIQLDDSVQITGTLTGSTIEAETVIVPTKPEPVTTTS